MFFFLFLLLFVVIMVLVGNRNEREDEDPTYEDKEGFEREEDVDLEGGNETSKTSSTSLWQFVTKLEGEKGGGTTKFLCMHDSH